MMGLILARVPANTVVYLVKLVERTVPQVIQRKSSAGYVLTVSVMNVQDMVQQIATTVVV